jgi:hypothetical protein
VVRFVKKVFADLRPRAALPALRQSIHEWRPDLVVRESAEFAAAIVAEEAGLPHARVAPHCGTAEMGLIALAAEPIDEIRRCPGSSRMRALRFERRRALRAFQPHSTVPSRSISGRRHFEYGNRRDRRAVTADRRHGRSRMGDRCCTSVSEQKQAVPPTHALLTAWRWRPCQTCRFAHPGRTPMSRPSGPRPRMSR